MSELAKCYFILYVFILVSFAIGFGVLAVMFGGPRIFSEGSFEAVDRAVLRHGA